MSDPDALAVAGRIHQRLLARGMTIATAESLTGGGLGDLLSGTPGASATYAGGVISYATVVKQDLLGVSPATVEQHGVVSAECAREMAIGAASVLGADVGVSTTGVAGPTIQEDKPVGLVFVGLAASDGVRVRELRLDGDRRSIRAQSCLRALQEIDEWLEQWTADHPGPGGRWAGCRH